MDRRRRSRRSSTPAGPRSTLRAALRPSRAPRPTRPARTASRAVRGTSTPTAVADAPCVDEPFADRRLRPPRTGRPASSRRQGCSRRGALPTACRARAPMSRAIAQECHSLLDAPVGESMIALVLSAWDEDLRESQAPRRFAARSRSARAAVSCSPAKNMNRPICAASAARSSSGSSCESTETTVHPLHALLETARVPQHLREPRRDAGCEVSLAGLSKSAIARSKCGRRLAALSRRFRHQTGPLVQLRLVGGSSVSSVACSKRPLRLGGRCERGGAFAGADEHLRASLLDRPRHQRHPVLRGRRRGSGTPPPPRSRPRPRPRDSRNCAAPGACAFRSRFESVS